MVASAAELVQPDNAALKTLSRRLPAALLREWSGQPRCAGAV